MAGALERLPGQVPQANLTPIGWVVGGDLSYDEWLRQGSRLGLAGRNAAWWIGDWVRYGTRRYGSKYTAAARVTGYDRQTLMNMVYVATTFEVSRRRENLSWSHHSEVASLEPEEQDRWLNRALVERLSIRDMREELSSVKHRPGVSRPRRGGADIKQVAVERRPAPRADGRGAKRAVICPHCGESFML